MFQFIKIKKFVLDNTIYRKYQIEYLNHINKVFKNTSINNNQNLILLEYYPSWTSIIFFTYLVSILRKKHKAKTVFYLPIRPNRLKIIYYNILVKFKIAHFKLLSFSSNDKLLIPNLSCINIGTKYSTKLKGIKKKSDILKIKFEGIKIGDVLYDSYLKKYNTYTIDPNSEKFKDYFIYFSKLFIFWFKYIKKNKVKSVIASHPVYENAIPLRISYSLGNKDSFTASIHFTYRHSKKHQSIEYDVKKRFKKLSKKEKKIGLKISNLNLIKKFNGGKTMDALLGERTPVVQKIKEKKINTSNNNVLIAIHSFSDAPHVFGNSIFEDHYEWLKFLGNETKKNTKFNWLLKVHPIFYDKEISIIHKILKDFPHIKILPKNVTNEELINKGVKFILSVYGSVTYEYAYFGIPSILATSNHPYKKYKFLKDASTKQEYKKIINNLENLKFSFSRDEVIEYYYMRFVRVNKLFKNYPNIVKTLGNQFASPLIYKCWLNEFTIKKNIKIMKKLNSYVDSKNYRFEYYN